MRGEKKATKHFPQSKKLNALKKIALLVTNRTRLRQNHVIFFNLKDLSPDPPRAFAIFLIFLKNDQTNC